MSGTFGPGSGAVAADAAGWTQHLTAALKKCQLQTLNFTKNMSEANGRRDRQTLIKRRVDGRMQESREQRSGSVNRLTCTFCEFCIESLVVYILI